MGSNVNENITAQDVITKLKDDGDFDRLRLKIVRQLKQNEDLRNNIVSVVKQSTALNRPGAENMKPRQLCDEIHDEIREKAMNQISDGLWEIIRSADGMKLEITETVQSVYDKLLNPQQKAEGKLMLSTSGQVAASGGTDSNGLVIVSQDSNGTMSDGEHKEAPGNSSIVEWGREPCQGNGPLQRNGDHSSPPPPGLFSSGKRRRTSDAHEDDPEIPPGFG